MNNPMPNMNPFMAAMQMAQNGKNPMQMLQQIMGSNPQFNQVMRVINSKDPASMKSTAEKMFKERGNVCKLCDRLVIYQAVTFTGGTLIINLPAGSYSNCEKYCIVVAQSIPATTTINAPVVITIGTGTQQYPLTKRNCAQVTACGIRTRTKYSTCVVTTPTGGSFRLMGNPCFAPNNNLQSIDGGATVVPSSINK